MGEKIAQAKPAHQLAREKSTVKTLVASSPPYTDVHVSPGWGTGALTYNPQDTFSISTTSSPLITVSNTSNATYSNAGDILRQSK